MQVLELTKTRTVDGVQYLHTQIFREDFPNGECICIYEVKNLKTQHVGEFEVFIPRIQKKDVKMPTGYVSPAGEKYPGNNDFGPRASYIGGKGTYDEKLKRANAIVWEFRQRILNKINKDAENTDSTVSEGQKRAS